MKGIISVFKDMPFIVQFGLCFLLVCFGFAAIILSWQGVNIFDGLVTSSDVAEEATGAGVGDTEALGGEARMVIEQTVNYPGGGTDSGTVTINKGITIEHE
jgi:hypothetical protein